MPEKITIVLDDTSGLKLKAVELLTEKNIGAVIEGWIHSGLESFKS